MYNVAEWFRCVRSPGRGGAGQRCFVCHASRLSRVAARDAARVDVRDDSQLSVINRERSDVSEPVCISTCSL